MGRTHEIQVLHEVRVGTYDTMRAFADGLNEYLILPAVDDAARLVAEYEHLLSVGRMSSPAVADGVNRGDVHTAE